MRFTDPRFVNSLSLSRPCQPATTLPTLTFLGREGYAFSPQGPHKFSAREAIHSGFEPPTPGSLRANQMAMAL